VTAEGLSERELVEIEARAKAATAGPWIRTGYAVRRTGTRGVKSVIATVDGPSPAYIHNSDFIVNARQDIPRLISTIRERDRLIDVMSQDASPAVDRAVSAERAAILRLVEQFVQKAEGAAGDAVGNSYELAGAVEAKGQLLRLASDIQKRGVAIACPVDQVRAENERLREDNERMRMALDAICQTASMPTTGTQQQRLNSIEAFAREVLEGNP